MQWYLRYKFSLLTAIMTWSMATIPCLAPSQSCDQANGGPAHASKPAAVCDACITRVVLMVVMVGPQAQRMSAYDMWSVGVVWLELLLGTPHVFQVLLCASRRSLQPFNERKRRKRLNER